MLAKDFWRVASRVSMLVAVGAICSIGQAQTVQAQTPAVCPPGQECPCTWSGWVNRDQPSGQGDYETLPDLIKEGKLKCRRPLAVQCRYTPNGAVWGSQIGTGTTYPPAPTAAGYHCETLKGGWCVNKDLKPTGTCKDSEVRFCCLPE
jgi:cartilage intermediate layer protein